MKFVTGLTVAFLMLALSATALAQNPIANPGFETWAGGAPASWLTDNAAPLFVPVTQTQSAHSGSSAMLMTVVYYPGVGTYPTWVWGGGGGASMQRSANLTGWYKFAPLGKDSLFVWAIVLKANNAIGSGEWTTGATVSSYTQFTVPIDYFAPGVPDSCWIWFALEGPNPYDSTHTGTAAYIDDLAFSGIASGVESQSGTPYTFALHQNYPNPFNPSTQIAYSVAKEVQVSITVYNILGQEVTTLVNEARKPGAYSVTMDASRLASGSYLYRMRAGDFVETKRLVVVK